MSKSQKNIEARKRSRVRNAELSRGAILEAALIEFSEKGFAGARVDEIAKRAGVSKPLLYGHFGDKDAIYAAALREAYVQIRAAERELNLNALQPEEAVRTLIRFTLQHFRDNPWFIAMLNNENLRGGDTIRGMQDAEGIQNFLINELADLLARGAAEGAFRSGVDPIEFYIHVASLCYMPVSNTHTLRVAFNIPMDDAWMDRHGESICDMVLSYLTPRP